jgi:hypothetical protein
VQVVAVVGLNGSGSDELDMGEEKRDEEQRDDSVLCCLIIYSRATAIETKKQLWTVEPQSEGKTYVVGTESAEALWARAHRRKNPSHQNKTSLCSVYVRNKIRDLLAFMPTGFIKIIALR